MTDPRSPYRAGAFFIGISAALHFLTLVFGLAAPTLMMQAVGAFYILVMSGLMQGWRWLAYLSFFMLSIGGIAALGWSFSVSHIPGWLFFSIFVVDFLAVAALFLALWRPAPEPEAN